MESFVIGGYRERSKASFGLWKKKTQYENELHFSFSMMYCSDSAENPLASIIIIRLANLWEGSFFLPDFTHNYPALTSSHKKSRFTRNPNEVFKLSPVTNGSLPLFYRPDLYLFWKKKLLTLIRFWFHRGRTHSTRLFATTAWHLKVGRTYRCSWKYLSGRRFHLRSVARRRAARWPSSAERPAPLCSGRRRPYGRRRRRPCPASRKWAAVKVPAIVWRARTRLDSVLTEVLPGWFTLVKSWS